MTNEILLGYEVGTGEAVKVPALHIAVTGQTQQSGKTTALEALASRSGSTVLTFITKRGLLSSINALRAEIANLAHGISAPADMANEPASRAPGTASIDFDYIYAEIKRRAAIDPVMIQLLMQNPEIEVKVERTVIAIDGTSLKGRVAALIAKGFMDVGKRHGEVRAELKRTGSDPNSGNLATALSDLQRMGFLTKETGDTYQAVKGMKVNVKQAA